MGHQSHIMIDNYNLFKSQLISACKLFPNLKIKLDHNNLEYLQGILDIPNENEDISYQYLIEIHYQKGFPYRFPKLFETGGEIPPLADYHKYNDNSCCITVDADEILKCRNGIRITDFIKNEVVPYFANQLHRKITGKYKDEYYHGSRGVREFYENLLHTKNLSLILDYIHYSFGNKKLNIRRNDLCMCGSGLKFKKCHLPIFKKIEKIGKDKVIKDLKLILY